MSKHLKAMEKALRVFVKAKDKLEKTMVQIDKDHADACERSAKVQAEQRSLTSAREQVSGIHSKISALLEVK